MIFKGVVIRVFTASLLDGSRCWPGHRPPASASDPPLLGQASSGRPGPGRGRPAFSVLERNLGVHFHKEFFSICRVGPTGPPGEARPPALVGPRLSLVRMRRAMPPDFCQFFSVVRAGLLPTRFSPPGGRDDAGTMSRVFLQGRGKGGRASPGGPIGPPVFGRL